MKLADDGQSVVPCDANGRVGPKGTRAPTLTLLFPPRQPRFVRRARLLFIAG
jgi:hypothetical protein